MGGPESPSKLQGPLMLFLTSLGAGAMGPWITWGAWAVFCFADGLVLFDHGGQLILPSLVFDAITCFHLLYFSTRRCTQSLQCPRKRWKGVSFTPIVLW